MGEPRYPGVADTESARGADGYRARYSDPYGTPADAGQGGDAAGAPRRSSYGGYPGGAEQPSYGGGRSRAESGRAYPEPAGQGRGQPGRGGYGAPPAAHPTPGQYPPGAYSAGTTYDTTNKSTYDTRAAGRQAQSAGQASPASRVASAMRRSMSAAARGPRRARLQLRHVDPWSTLKLSLVLAVALFVVWMVAIGLLYGVLDGMGVFDKVNGLYQDITGKDGAHIIGPGLVLGTAALIGAINIVLFTALATVGSFIYNMCADLVGGVEVTLSEHD